MFILWGRFPLIGLVILIVWGCAVSGHQAVDGGDAAYARQMESDVNDGGVISQDTAYNSQIESGVIDVSVIPFDAATDIGADTSIANSCRVVDLEENNTDAAAMDATIPTAPTISGTIIHNGDCVSGVEVCLTRMDFDETSYNVLTDRYGVFEVPVSSDTLTGSASLSLTPRKAGYRFEPSSSSLSRSITDSGVSGLSFTAVEVGIPDYATGQWRVVEVSCSGPDYCGHANILQGFQKTFFDEYHPGDVLTFEDGCLFGGINCVAGSHYSDTQAKCIGMSGQFHSSTLVNEGDYDPATQSWQIVRTERFYAGMRYDTMSQNIVLKQESSYEDASM
jgi:hypothetical protein